MPRPPRLDHAGAWHHVTNRGRNQQTVFNDGHDFRLFLRLLSIASKVHQVEVHSYCLMTNHYHLLIRSKKGELSAAMQFVGSRYTLDYNERHGLDGALFKGRFFSKLIQNQDHLMETVRYIPNNPVKAGLVERPEHYEWSSYRHTIGLQPTGGPGCLDITTTVDWLFGGNLATFEAFVRRSDTNQSRLVAHALESHDTEPRLDIAVEHVQARLRRFEDLSPASSMQSVAMAQIASFVADVAQLPLHTIVSPIDQPSKTARGLLLTLLYRHQIAPLRDLATAFGFASRGSAHAAIRRFEASARAETSIAALLDHGLQLDTRAA